MTAKENIGDDAVELWTDGSSAGRTGPGGWAAILSYKNVQREISGGCPNDETNNSMELQAILEGLLSFKYPTAVRVFTDSENAMRWIEGTYRCRVKKNQALVYAIRRALMKAGLCVDWRKVSGHTGVELNERADLLAKAARQRATGTKANWRRDVLIIDGEQVESLFPEGAPNE